MEPGGGFLGCARVLPVQSRPQLARGTGGGGGGPGTLRGTCVRLGTLGLPALRVSVCGYFERGGSGLLTTSCPLEGR